jgi:hypothetical protein
MVLWNLGNQTQKYQKPGDGGLVLGRPGKPPRAGRVLRPGLAEPPTLEVMMVGARPPGVPSFGRNQDKAWCQLEVLPPGGLAFPRYCRARTAMSSDCSSPPANW